MSREGVIALRLSQSTDRNSNTLHYFLELFQSHIQAEMVCAGMYNVNQRQASLLVAVPAEVEPTSAIIFHYLSKHFAALPDQIPASVMILDHDALDKTPFAIGIFHFDDLDSTDEITWVGALFHEKRTIDDYLLAELGHLGQFMLQMRMSKPASHVRDSSAVLSSLAERMPTLTNEQEIVSTLVDLAFTDHISACALLVYQGDIQNEAFTVINHAEVAGIWGRNLGQGYGIGTRFYLDTDAPIVSILDEERVVHSKSEGVDAYLPPDALLRALLKSPRIRHWMVIALHIPQYPLGVLCLATDRPNPFSVDEIAFYRQIGDLVTPVLAMQLFTRQQRAYQSGREALLNAVNDGIVIAYPQTNGAEVMLVNERFRQIFGFDGEVSGIKLNNLIRHLRIPQTVQHALITTWGSIPFRTTHVQNGEFEMISWDAQPLQIQWYSAPVILPQTQTVIARLYTFHNATPERAAVQVRSAFLSRVSHELRTPLTSISGFAQSILETHGNDLPDNAYEYTQIILDSAQKLKRVFTDLIEITRAYSGETQLNLQPIHLKYTLLTILQNHHGALSSRQITTNINIQDDLPPILADVKLISQVLANLLLNAINFSSIGGDITIQVRPIVSEALPEHVPSYAMLPAVLVSFYDTGPGIEPQDVEQIFEPFFRSDYARRHRIEGAGLGLAVCRSILDLHQGEIWVEPNPPNESGGKLHFTLPIVS